VARSIGDVSFALSSSQEVLAHYNITENTVSLFRQVDDKRLDMKIPDEKKIDATRMSRFIEMNKLHLVTEYGPMVMNRSPGPPHPPGRPPLGSDLWRPPPPQDPLTLPGPP
uniref:Uncharacterized protein n=1 Tax=Ornithorhynchus anatinus TaxID=9258 RepID=F7ET41_ORNAN